MTMAIHPLTLFICTFLLLKTVPGGVSQKNYLPKIKLRQNLGEEWQQIRNIPTIKSPVFYSPPQELGDLPLQCEAPYPITWNLTGFIAPAEVVKIQPPIKNSVKNTYEILVNIFFLEGEEFRDVGASLRISCEKVGDPVQADEIFVFVRGGTKNPFVVPKLTTVIDSTLIPCPTRDPSPSVAPLLYRRHRNGNEEQVRSPSVLYHPSEGFHSSEMFNGDYICKQGPHIAVPITAYVSREIYFTPKTNTVRVFSDESIQFECFSKSQRPVRIVVDDAANKAGNITVSQQNVKHRAIVKVSSKRPSVAGVKGKAFCVEHTPTLDSGAFRPIEWTFEFIPAPELLLENFESEVDCLSDVIPKSVQTVRCRNQMDCNFMSHCLENVTHCNFKKQKQFYASKETSCWLEKIGASRNCSSVPYSHLNGLAQCTVDGLVKRWNFFMSLAYLKYSDWKKAPEQELLRMDEMSPILYTNGTTRFICEAVAYLFSKKLGFEIMFENGTRRPLENSGNNTQISSPGQENPRIIDEFNVLGQLDIKLPLDAVGITCIAPFGNSTEELRTTRKFQTRHLQKPELTENVRNIVKKETFYTGEKNRRLTCYAKGEPQPVYHWYHKNENVSIKFPELITGTSSNGEGYLEFPDISNNATIRNLYKGEYRCSAENKVGRVEQRFVLEISDEPISTRSVLYIVSVVVILLVLGIVLTMLYIFIKKYNEAKELVRSLTDSEIDEFFMGKPELLADTSGNNLEVVDFLPYKSEYEIALDDLEFDSSETNVLGSGEFSYVIRGKILSKNKIVALKISKTSADVTLFKTLLSEVKIMIYIGVHDNVITLIGVCTAGIRNRSIYIATEICDLGSLDVFLRKARPTFSNLINPNQEIDTSLVAECPHVQDINTLDLISFCAQIAKGMEYLAYKSIVHADLAARNVLLTRNKVAKISDFGLSKKLYECNNYVKKSKTPLPWRWMSIEALNSLTFSTKSDIWAYGVTLFEIFTLGDVPFPNEEWNKEFIARLASGMRMGRPRFSTQEIYSQIMICWENEPELRPGFGTLRTFFEQMLDKYSFTGSVDDDQNGKKSGPTNPGNFRLGKQDNENVTADNNNAGSTAPHPKLIHTYSNEDSSIGQRKYANTPSNDINENVELKTVSIHQQPQPFYANVD